MSIDGMTILFAGSGAFGAPTLTRLIDAGARIVRVYTQPDRPAGRGKKLTPTPIAELALSRGIDVVRTADINKESLPDADAMVVIAFGQKIAPHVVDHPKFGSINLHASRLPKYRGAAPINWAIVDGDRTTGNSVIRLAERMDAGAVLGQSEIQIGETETTGELHDRLAIDGAPLVERVLTELREGRATETPQDDSHATVAPKLTRAHATLNWSEPAQVLCNAIRGLYPWPGCRVRLIDPCHKELARLTLVRARPVERRSSGFVGIIDELGHVGAADNMIEILEVQPEGKRPMSLDAFRNGHAWAPESRLESIV
jgi:methionyl-tRNA formyltransferase